MIYEEEEEPLQNMFGKNKGISKPEPSKSQ